MALLEFEDLTKVYPNGIIANDGITLDVSAGEVLGLLGPNGAGKTTLVSQLFGLVRPTAGGVRLAGVDVVADPGFARRECSYQPQAGVATTGLTPLQVIELCGRIRGGTKEEVRRRARDLLASLQLEPWVDRATPLSGGVARLVAFCMAAVRPGRVAVLDEPTNDVDPLRRRLLWAQVRALADTGAAVLLVTHNVLEADRCVDRLAIVDRGRVVGGGTPAEMKSDLSGSLRLELVLPPGRPAPPLPGWASRPASTGRRLLVQVSLGDAGRAVEWATAAQARGETAEFSLQPASLEDVYLRAVRPAEPEEVALPAAIG
jgi:ABC-2 type transport system ATP-binding protein